MSSPPNKKQLTEQDVEFDFANEDIKIEVLTRLSAKSMLRLKCVSKGWQHITSDASFRQIHSQKTKPDLSGFYFQERFRWCTEDIETVTYISVDSEESCMYRTTLNFLPEKIVIMASSNGVLCGRGLINARHPMIYICNPCTKEYVALKWDGPNMNGSVGLVFDPSHNFLRASTSSGSIFTSFKLVNIYKIEDEKKPHYRFELYSSKMKNWRLLKEICCDSSNLLKKGGVFANGLLHWLTTSNKIITFDVETEKAQLVDAPPVLQPRCIPEMCIGESKGCLHYICISEIGFRDWVLKDASKSKWELNESLSLEAMEELYPQFFFYMSTRVTSRLTMDMEPWADPLAFKDDFLFLIVSSSVFLFNFDTLELRRLCSVDLLGPNALGGSPMVLPYSMSLAPVVLP